MTNDKAQMPNKAQSRNLSFGFWNLEFRHHEMTEFTPASLNRMDATRLAAYRTNLDFYNGSQWQQTSRNRQLVFNYAKATIDKITSFLMQGLGFACYPNSTNTMNSLNARVRKAEQLLRQVYDQNNLQ